MSFGLTFSFAEELFEAIHDFDGDTFKAALYTDEKGQDLTAYTATNEISGTGYTAGGATANLTLARTNNTVNLTLTDLTITNPQTAKSFLIYNSSKANRSMLVGPLSAEPGTVTIKSTVPIMTLTV